MLVVEKARHIEVEIRGPGTESVLAILRLALPSLEATDDDAYEPVEGSDWFAALAAEVTPGATLRAYRDNAGWTQAALSAKTGIPIPHLSGMENDRRPIGKATAKKLAAVFGTDFRRFV